MERDEANPNIHTVRDAGGLVVVTGQLDEQLFDRLRASAAEALFCTCGSDTQNIYAAEALASYLNRSGDKADQAPPIFVHLFESSLADRLNEFPRFVANYAADLRFWSESQILAEHALERFPPDRFANIAGADRPDILLIGAGQHAEAAAREIALCAHYRSLKPPVITWVRPDAGGAQLSHQMQKVAAAALLVPCPHTLADILADSALLCDVIRGKTQVFVTECGGISGLAVTLELRRAMIENCLFMAPILRWPGASDELSEGEENSRDAREIPDNIYAFEAGETGIDYTTLVRREEGMLARRVHELAKPDMPWRTLPFSMREASRASVRSWPAKLEAIGVTMKGEGRLEGASDKEMSLMVAMEHERWFAERHIDGWRYGAERSDIAKLHPLLRHWGDLAEEERAGNRAYFQGAFDDLNRIAGEGKVDFNGIRLGLSRVCTIGVTGHRWAELAPKAGKELTSRIDAALEAIREKNPGCHFRIVSAFADGADRFVAQRAMDVLNAELIGLLPMPYELYRIDFSKDDAGNTGASEAEFERLVAKAAWYVEIPPVYTNIARMSGYEDDSRARQYASLGAHLVAMCDELIAVWDGKPGRGLGGTADVVDWWKTGDIPSDLVVKHPLRPRGPRGDVHIVPFDRG